MGALAAFEDEVEEYRRLMLKSDQTEDLTVRSAVARMAETKIEKLLLNSGYTAEELAFETGLNPEDILNEENWRENQFIAPTGVVYDVVFNYTGSIFKVHK
jgi:hypothetical protein